MNEDLLSRAREAAARSTAPTDPDWPVFHVAPPVGRLNDPNGLLVDGDTFHVFYQYTPEHPRKLVYWGHATSTDLVHWNHHDPAILPDCHQDRNGAYSGTALATEDGVELWYTGNYKDPDTGQREATQCVVTTRDLVHFDKLRTPVVTAQPEGYTAHFRDPQVWLDPDSPVDAPSWRMLLGAQREDLTGAALLYRSEDRRSWRLEGELTFPDAGGAFDSFGYMWECPNLVRMRDEATGRTVDVLIFCPQGIAPQREGFENVFPCVYVVGHLEGTRFLGADGTYEELDRGFEFYAPQVFAHRAHSWGDVDGAPAPLLIGWAGNAGEDDQPSMASGGWVHALTTPRELHVVGGVLHQRPHLPGLPLQGAAVEGPEALGGEGASMPVRALEGARAWRVRLHCRFEGAAELVMGVGGDSGLEIRLSADRLQVDRSGTRYPHGGVRTVSLDPGEAEWVEIVHDRSITEVFLGNGRRVFTLRSFLEGTGSGIDLRSFGAVGVDRVEVARLD
ncbi:glycoside hydrolase family 32 protein [Schaalia sp. 19OD2882]|uniref:glycoside hydrolase family 32 protein n=1 Tax=Schaalia sp. 19OD2882 TaxID=2794089 RepID=UPI001C1F0B54|nr:glycoside hydrolase family 32 protein [Schaalia sp. 19OD2882]QWW18675.1 glycoside hydrolase family 32 protein [Schaalia sp. 19OD2882]